MELRQYLIGKDAGDTYPGEAQAVDGIGEHVSQQGRGGVQSWEVRVHVRALPMGNLKQMKKQTLEVVTQHLPDPGKQAANS